MNASTVCTRKDLLRIGLSIAFAIAALAVLGTRAQAAPSLATDNNEVTITATHEKTIPYDPVTRGPVHEVTVTARVRADLDSLTQNSGVALLKDDVRDAARKVCTMADSARFDRTSDDYVDCVHRAVRSAEPQVAALVARARASENG
jgi:UrcA family protein